MGMNFSPQVPHLRLVQYERTLILLFWTRLVIGRKTLGGPGWVRYTVTTVVKMFLLENLPWLNQNSKSRTTYSIRLFILGMSFVLKTMAKFMHIFMYYYEPLLWVLLWCFKTDSALFWESFERNNPPFPPWELNPWEPTADLEPHVWDERDTITTSTLRSSLSTFPCTPSVPWTARRKQEVNWQMEDNLYWFKT